MAAGSVQYRSMVRVPEVPERAWVRLPSGRRLDLLAPTPFDWTDEDLSIGLARTYRWGGHSVWPGAPLSVAQHSLMVLEMRRRRARLTPGQQLRELLHDADEGLINFDCISPLKPFLGPRYADLVHRLTAAIAARYGLPAWTEPEHRSHKAVDVAAAAAEAVFVAGWTREEVRETLGILAPVKPADPLMARYGGEAWRPWLPEVAAERFLAELKRLTFAARSFSPLSPAPSLKGKGRLQL
jgi:uncharacterized protein